MCARFARTADTIPIMTTPPPLPSAQRVPLDNHGPAADRDPSAPLTPADMLLVKKAIIARRYVRRAAWVALFSAGTMLALGALSLLLALLSLSPFEIAVSIALIAFGYGEYRGAVRMKRADASAPWFLCRNQLLFIAFIAVLTPIVVYRYIPVLDGFFALSPEFNEALTELPGMQGDIQSMQTKIHQASIHYAPYVVAAIILLVAVSQGSLALYYFRCKARIRKYQDATPEWVQNVLAATAT